MKSAEEILKEEVLKINESDRPYYYEDIYDGYATDIYNAINAARKECIEECAKRAKAVISNPSLLAQQVPSGYNTLLQNQSGCYVDKQSILNLIKELK